jgi:mediator of replication checkpoint protein 1
MFTQTKPSITSPLSPRTIMAWPFTPSPPESPSKLKPSSSDTEGSPRKPGRGLKRRADLEAEKEADASSSPRKIARTESTENIASPSDAFAMMMANRQFVDAKKEKRRQREVAEKEELEAIEKEFVAGEADESDDELDFGFGKTQKTDEDIQGDEPTAEDKAMVDDRVLRAHELREDAVLEKHK